MHKFVQAKQITRMGFVIDWEFHKNDKWVSALTPYLVKAIINEFNPIIITSQDEYEKVKTEISDVISMEPGWAAPRLTYDNNQRHRIGIFISDPHNKVEWLEDYVRNNNISAVFSYYFSPFFYHFPKFPREKFFHVPWAIPDDLINEDKIVVRNGEVAIFGGRSSDAYDVRNWCREQPGVSNYENSGVENKKMSDQDYFKWLKEFDAIIAAGSTNPIYDLVTPKYYEIASSGALLFGQECNDLKELGFNSNNSVIFNKFDFNQKIKEYKERPRDYIAIRHNGRELIKKRHKVSDRISLLKLFYSKN